MTRLTMTIEAIDRDGVRVPPRTKKNHPVILPHVMRTGKDGVRRPVPVLIPSKEYTEWERAAKRTLKATVLAQHKAGKLPINQPVNCRAIIYREKLVGDATGFYDAIGDFLQVNFGTDEAPVRIVTNDKWLVQWDGSRLRKDKDRPRVEIVLEPVSMSEEEAAEVGQGALFGEEAEAE